MVELMDIGIDNAIALNIKSRVTQEDVEYVLRELREKLNTHSELVVLKRIEKFVGVNFDAIVREAAYLFREGLPKITKVAIVSDKNWIKNVVEIEDFIFGNIEMKTFPLSEEDKAIEFLKK